MFVELHARSAFSFLQGASLPEELAAVCAELGMPAMAVTDLDGVYAAPRFHMAAKKLGLKAHIGAEVTLGVTRLPLPVVVGREPETGNGKPETARLPLLAATRTGYQNLCRLITRMKLRPVDMPGVRDPEHAATTTALDELGEFSKGLVCLTGGEDGPLAGALHRGGPSEGRRTVERWWTSLAARTFMSNCSGITTR